MQQFERRMFIRGAISLMAVPALARVIPDWLTLAAQSQQAMPFRMLVLGDSVVWGQGLNEDAKFYTIVQKGLEQQLGRRVDKLNLSHSGATILPKAKPCPALPGEVPIVTPTIYTQANAALSLYAAAGIKPEEVDLVLLNGGINDIGFPVIVNPFTSDKKLTDQSKKYCFKEMSELLRALHQSFPNAHLVVAGYFPIISKATDPNVLPKLIQAFLGLSNGDKVLRAAAKQQREQSKRAAKVNDEKLMRSNWLVDRLAQLSDVWKTRSDADLQAAVDAVNANARTATFVKVVFADDECYAANKTNLWKITGSSGGVGNLITDDQMFSQRGETCRLIQADLKGTARLICPVAGTGHPNSFGSKKYAAAILEKLSTILSKVDKSRS
ncbi:MAG TPA: SGNH/GDSL hydrolase family protein [Pyrinomonadaceae bacterium]|nr:SGNH/GDSL hydrolase family protein [Pyrinomonadaceae bacterium]